MPKPLNLVPTRLNNEEKRAIDDPQTGLSGPFLQEAVLPLLKSDATDGGRFRPKFYEEFKSKVEQLEGEVVTNGWIEGFYPSVLISRGEDIILALLALNKFVDTKDPEIIKAVANVMRLELEPEREGRIAKYMQNRQKKAAQKTLTAMLTPDAKKPAPTGTPALNEAQTQTQPLARKGSLKPGLDSTLKVIMSKRTKQNPDDVDAITPAQNTELIINSMRIILSTGYVGEVVLERISTNLDVLSIALHEAEQIKRRSKAELNNKRQEALDELDRLQRSYVEAKQLREQSLQSISQFEDYRRQQGDRGLEPYDLRTYVNNFHSAARANVVLREVLTSAGIGEARLDAERILLEAHHAHVESTLDIATVAAMRTTTALAALGLGIEVCVRTVTSQAFKDARQRELELQMARIQLQERSRQLQTNQYKIGSIMLGEGNPQLTASRPSTPAQPMRRPDQPTSGATDVRRGLGEQVKAATGETQPNRVPGAPEPVRRDMSARQQPDEARQQGGIQRPEPQSPERPAGTPLQRPTRPEAAEENPSKDKFATRPMEAIRRDESAEQQPARRFGTRHLDENDAAPATPAAPSKPAQPTPATPERPMRLVPRMPANDGDDAKKPGEL